MRAIVVLFVVVAFHGAVYAQPGQGPAAAPPAPPYPYPPAQPYPPATAQPYPVAPGQQYPLALAPPTGVVAPYQYAPIQLSADEQELLNKGEISDRRHIGGVITSLFFGLGIGQAVQGRYGETGWIFTVGEGASFVAFTVGIVKTFGDCFAAFDEERSCDRSSGGVLLAGGLIGLVVFRVWEIADAIGGPPKHNAKVRQLRLRLGMPPTPYARKLQPYVAPTLSRDGGATAGLTLRF